MDVLSPWADGRDYQAVRMTLRSLVLDLLSVVRHIQLWVT